MGETKICSTCKIEYPATLQYFYRASDRPDGLRCNCKCCCKKRGQQYYYENKETILAYGKCYKEKNKDKVNRSGREWYRKNRDKKLTYAKEYEIKNKSLIAKRVTKYYQRLEVKSRMKIRNHKTRIGKKKLRCDLTQEKWIDIMNYFNNRCAYCGEERKLEQDHFVPFSKGGEYSHDNIIPACKRCNSSKNCNDFFEWYPQQKFYSKSREKKILSFLHYSNNIQQLSLF